MDLTKNLNKEQLEAVSHKDGPLLIVAGAGTGKTTVITQRIAYLIERGLAKPEEILALTFTEKAAGEMSDRVDALLPYGYFDLWISTFHSFAERILKEHGLSIGLPADFKLLNEFGQWALVKKNLDKFELDYYRPLGNPTKFIHALLKHFSRAKDENISPEQYLKYAEELEQNLDGMLGGAPVIPAQAPCFLFQRRGRQRGVIQATRNWKKQKNLDPRLRGDDKREGGDDERERVASASDKEMTEKIAEQEAARLNEVANAYHVYQQLLLDNNALDFGDLINYCLKLFRERSAILEKYRRQFKYILLDEFQDTNWSQYELIKILAAPKNNLTVVGDDDQSIFRFRGASMSNILQFVKDYPGARKIFLTANYRSRQNILDLSYEFIKQNNPNRLEWRLGNPKPSVIPASEPPRKVRGGLRVGARNDKIKGKGHALNKKLIAQDRGKGVIEIIRAADLAGEVEAVVDKIMELKRTEKEATWNDFAILIRANDSANDFIPELDRRGLPYIFGASRGLYSKPVIMDVISYFKLLDNYHESAAVWRILNLPIYKFSEADLINFNHLAGKKALSLFEVLNQAEVFKFSAELKEKIKSVLALVAKHTALARRQPVSAVLLAFMNDSGYLKYLTKQTERQSLESVSLLNQFLKRLKSFESASDQPRLARSSGEAGDKSVKAFLAELNLELEAGEEGGLSADLEAGPEAIKILTVHGAKGLEFKYVFIANLVDKRFPTAQRSEQIILPEALINEILPEGDVHLEEERRLFYVAMTRAKLGLYFSWAPDYGGLREKKPSRFLMETGLIENTARKDKKAFEMKNYQISNLEKRISNEFLNSKLEIKNSKFNQNSKLKIKNSDNITNLIIPSHFSYSQLAAYSNCPYQYRFAHILKIPVMGKEQFSFGKTMHSTLEKLFALVSEKQNLKQADLFGDITPLQKGGRGVMPSNAKPPLAPPYQGEDNTLLNKGDKGGFITLEEIYKLYEQSWIDDWYESKKKKQERKQQGREILKVFYEKHKDNWPKVIFLEKGFNLKITRPEPGRGDGGQEAYVIRGVIDRVDQTEAGLKLVDYKTGRAKKDLKFEDKEQLFIYQLAAQELFKQPVSGLAFYYLDNNSEIEFIGDSADLEKIKNKIICTIEAIKKGDFPPRPGRLCAWCDFNGICEYRA